MALLSWVGFAPYNHWCAARRGLANSLAELRARPLFPRWTASLSLGYYSFSPDPTIATGPARFLKDRARSAGDGLVAFWIPAVPHYSRWDPWMIAFGGVPGHRPKDSGLRQRRVPRPGGGPVSC